MKTAKQYQTQDRSITLQSYVELAVACPEYQASHLSPYLTSTWMIFATEPTLTVSTPSLSP